MTLRLKPPQSRVFACDQRFRVLVAGRRFGKTYLALVELCQAASVRGRLAWYVAPTYKQAKRIAWKPRKDLTRPYWANHADQHRMLIDRSCKHLIQDFEQGAGRLIRTANPLADLDKSNPMRTHVSDASDTWWPARSRCGRREGNDRDRDL